MLIFACHGGSPTVELSKPQLLGWVGCQGPPAVAQYVAYADNGKVEPIQPGEGIKPTSVV
jgi:hypothetical protein